MIFNTAAKAQLVALVESLEPTPEVNPLQAELDAANLTIAELNTTVESQAGTIASLNAKIAAAQQALA